MTQAVEIENKNPIELTSEIWPPDYTEVFKERISRIREIERGGAKMKKQALAYYKKNPVDFINHWCMTYDPRNAAKETPVYMPFCMFKKQEEFVEWLHELIIDQENGLVEKSRDMGATWVACGFSVWCWLFLDGSAVGWGSRKEALVDRIGDPDSIFEKIRIIIKYLPEFLTPEGLSDRDHLLFMKCINPANGSTITGEGGDNIGRGGRKLIYFKDESAHYERPELIEAALADNTNVQVDISSVNGAGNVFYRNRHSGMTSVFIMDWRDHPHKTQNWYDKRKAEAEAKGLEHIFAQEVDRDYSSAVEGILIPAKYVNAAVDAHLKLGFKPEGAKHVGFDPADEGGDENAVCSTHGSVVMGLEKWVKGDTGKSTKRAYSIADEFGAKKLTYDSIGVGAGVKAKLNEIIEEIEAVSDDPDFEISIEAVGWNAGGEVVDKKREYMPGKLNSDMFSNAKAQAWWHLRDRFAKTYRAIYEGDEFDPSELISLPSELPHLQDLKLELSRPLRDVDNANRVKVESKKQMKKRGMPSPNLADALIMCYVNTRKPRKIRVMSI